MNLSETTAKVTEIAASTGMGDPVAMVLIFPGDEFISVGDKDRDHDYVGHELILAATREYEKGMIRAAAAPSPDQLTLFPAAGG